MAHFITAVIGTQPVVARIVNAAGCPTPTELPFGLCIAPLGHEQIDRLTGDEPWALHEGFMHLSTKLEAALLEAVGDMTLAYVETDYFGGAGSQAAAVMTKGEVLLRAANPVSRKPPQPGDPINTALRALGVPAAPGEDEFDAIGLGNFRTLETLGLEEPDEDLTGPYSIGAWREVSRSEGEGSLSIVLSGPDNRYKYVVFRPAHGGWNFAYESSGLFFELDDAVRDARAYVEAGQM